MKKTISIILAAVLALGCIFGFAACSSGSKGITIAVPNDATNEARALLLLQEQGNQQKQHQSVGYRDHDRTK